MADTQQTLNQQIDALRQSVANVQALSNSALSAGKFGHAQKLAAQAVVLSNALAELQMKRRGEAIHSDAWSAIDAHLNTLLQQTRATKQQVATAQDNVETVKSLVSLIAKVAVV